MIRVRAIRKSSNSFQGTLCQGRNCDAKVEDHGYAVPYLVRDIIVECLKLHCQHNDYENETPKYWMTIICNLFKKIPFKYYEGGNQYDDESEQYTHDWGDEVKQDFDLTIYDYEGLIKKKKEDGKDLSREEEAKLDACYVMWNYTLLALMGHSCWAWRWVLLNPLTTSYAKMQQA